MPSQRKRIGFLPSKEVHEIIDKLCRANEFSQSKITGLLVEEALRSRGVLSDSFSPNAADKLNMVNSSFETKTFSKKSLFTDNIDDYVKNKKVFSEDVKLMHEFIEYKYFKRVMNQYNDILE
jgi:hypothetical protein